MTSDIVRRACPPLLESRKLRKGFQSCQQRSTAITSSTFTSTAAILAELDLLMAIDGFPTIADLRAGGAQRI
jgi:hypothetical protein